MIDQKIIEEATYLATLLDKQADALLPQEVAKVVKAHSKLAVASAWIPVPGADVAAGATTIWTMYTRINGKIGLTIKDNALKTIASGVATNLVSYAAMIGVGSILKGIPVLGPVAGGFILSASLYAITIVSGWVYLKALCILAEKDGTDLDLNKLGDAVKEVMSDSHIKELLKEAKKDYKK